MLLLFVWSKYQYDENSHMINKVAFLWHKFFAVNSIRNAKCADNISRDEERKIQNNLG